MPAHNIQTALSDAVTRATQAARTGPAGTRANPEPLREATPAADAVIARDGEVIATARAGSPYLFDTDGQLLPDTEQIGPDTVFDLASLTKIVVTVTALTLVRQGVLDLDDPVVAHLPEFDDDGERSSVTVRHLLTHTSGLPPIFPHWELVAQRSDRVTEVLSVPLIAQPGSVQAYSCVGYQTLGLILERRTGAELPELVASLVTEPSSMTETSYVPRHPDRCAPTEYQDVPARGLVRGQVHDEAAWVLGGAGNAGLFGTAADVLRFTEAIRTATGPVDEQIREWMSTDQLPEQLREHAAYGQAFGMRVGDASFMGADADGLIGHTGYTGTSLVIDPVRGLSVVVLTNRVHSHREAFTVQGLRRSAVELAQAG